MSGRPSFSFVATTMAFLLYHNHALLVLLDEFTLDKDQIRLLSSLDGLHLQSREDNQRNERQDKHLFHCERLGLMHCRLSKSGIN